MGSQSTAISTQAIYLKFSTVGRKVVHEPSFPKPILLPSFVSNCTKSWMAVMWIGKFGFPVPAYMAAILPQQ